MKRALWIVVVLVVLVSTGSFWALRVRKNHELKCQNNMRQLYGAGISYCLMERLNPESMLKIDDLAPFLRPNDTICPSGRSVYASFSVLNGPTCPNGHQFEPGEPRPFRASSLDSKLRGLYREFGFTNLIVNATGSNGPANGR